jgi:hypothetical protein
MSLRFLKEAVDEFAEAVKYYNSERPGLGFELASEIRKALKRIKKFRNAWPVVSSGVRRCLVGRFPFAILFSIESATIVIIAIMHMKRKPGYWKKRLGELK